MNTHLFWQYVSTPHATVTNSITQFTQPWFEGMARWYGADNTILGCIVLIGVVVSAILFKSKNHRAKTIHQLLGVITGITVAFQLALHSFEPHYALPVWIVMLLFLPLLLPTVKVQNRPIGYLAGLLLLFINSVVVLKSFSPTHGYAMADGWTLPKIIVAADYIATDAQDMSGVNVASLLDGDTRAYPLRYTLAWKSIPLDSEEKYPTSRVLYVVSTRDQQALTASPEWELSSFKPFTIVKQWDLGNTIQLYRLDKSADHTQ